jgi:predicted Zn-dependent peptidase
MSFCKSVLPNGIRVVTEKVPNVYSVSLGVCLDQGSRNETKQENGLFHLIEHLFFKGTSSMSAKDIAIEVDLIGGELNGFTSREFTYFYARFLDEYIEKAWALLSDILNNPKFGYKEIEVEKNVVLEEIKSFEDSPTEQALYLLLQSLFEPHPLSYSIMGTQDNIKKFTRDTILSFRNQYYKSSNLIIGASGNIEHTSLVELVKTLKFPQGKVEKKYIEFPSLKRRYKTIPRKDISQVHVAIGTRTIGYRDPNRYAWLVLNTLLGGSMSSRLFQRLREEEGLVYEIHSSLELFSDVGIFSIYFITDPKNVDLGIKCVWEELEKLRKKGLEPGELERTKTHLKGTLLLSLESITARMVRILSNEMYLGRYIPIEETVENIEKVNEEVLHSIFQSYFIPDIYAISKVGPI